MAKLEDLKVGSSVRGLANNEPVQIIATNWHGSSVLEVTYKNARGMLASQLLYRDSEDQIEVEESSLPWSFDADGNAVRLASEAYRINLAHLFDPYLAIHTSSVEPLPHQISAVYQEMLPRLPLRYVLADDPGAGKTIMTGLLLKELLIRGDLKRCLIVSPGGLSEQWQDELFGKFHLKFEIITNDRIEASATGNIFTETSFCICRLDKLARDDRLQEKLKVTEWDLIVVDEAHKMSARIWQGENKYTKRFNLGRLLSKITRHFLLLTATPHNGKEDDFQLFLSLIDQDRFGGSAKCKREKVDVSDVMRRLVKEDLLKFDGTPLFPERRAYTANYDLSESEAELYRSVTDYVREEFNRAERLNDHQRNTVGFALTVLQRRLASSPEAIFQSLFRRRQRLENRLKDARQGKQWEEQQRLPLIDDGYDDDDYLSSETEQKEETLADHASASRTIQELEAEIATLKSLEGLAAKIRNSGEDRKWDELSKLLQDEKLIRTAGGLLEKLIIFTEHRDTLNYLRDKITTLLGSDEAVVTIHGGTPRDDRRKVETLFRQDKNVRILIATDAAGEGLNLQRAHLMINYDLPWNPNRLEQRFGRIHRIGQQEVCHLWNLVSPQTREGMVFHRLLSKLEEEKSALGGKVFDILGELRFDNKPLRELLISAIRYGNDEKVRRHLTEVVDISMNTEKFRELLAENALTEDSMDFSKVMEIRAEMERMETRRLQPHFIEAYFLEAFRSLGGTIHRREHGRYEITSVPTAIRNHSSLTGYGRSVLKQYERICFAKENCSVPGYPEAVLICPGHPLLDTASALILERHGSALKRGTVFVDDHDDGLEPRLLFYIEDAIQDGQILPGGSKRIISKHIHFVELKENGTATNAGYAPYLDYRALKEDELEPVMNYIRQQEWLNAKVGERAQEHAVTQIIPAHLAQVKNRRLKKLEKLEKAVNERMIAEIQYWDGRAYELKVKEDAGEGSQNETSARASRRAQELDERRQKRLDEIAAERQISATPPVIVGGSLIIPRGLLHRLTNQPTPDTFSLNDRRAVELAGMRAVMEIEKHLGFIPKDVSNQNCGYDVESEIPREMQNGNSGCLRFIEVKSRVKGAATVTVTQNEMISALNAPREFILALVEVDGENTSTVYLKEPFRGLEQPKFMEVCRSFKIKELIKNGEVTYRQG